MPLVAHLAFCAKGKRKDLDRTKNIVEKKCTVEGIEVLFKIYYILK